MTRKLTSLFVSHGSPDLILHDHPARSFLESLGRTIGRPDAIVVVSAHWREQGHVITGAGPLETIHDFRGFAEQLYRLRYEATAPQGLVDTVTTALPEVRVDNSRGLDHGAWAPLQLMYPKADIGIVQLSLNLSGNERDHFETGKKLRALASDNILLMASGASVHNLSKLGPKGSEPAQWATQFEDWLARNIARNDVDGLLGFAENAPMARLAHPTSEHLMPLFVALGAAPEGEPLQRLHHSFDYGSIGMSCFAT